MKLDRGWKCWDYGSRQRSRQSGHINRRTLVQGPLLFRFSTRHWKGWIKNPVSLKSHFCCCSSSVREAGAAVTGAASVWPVLLATLGLGAQNGHCRGNYVSALTGPSREASLSLEQFAAVSHNFTRLWQLLRRGRPRNGACLKSRVPKRRVPILRDPNAIFRLLFWGRRAQPCSLDAEFAQLRFRYEKARTVTERAVHYADIPATV